MSGWVQTAVLASLCFAGHTLLLRGASGKVGDAFGGFLLEASAALGLLGLLIVLPKDGIKTTSSGVLFSVASGLCISLGVWLLFVSLRRGGPIGATGTIALGGGVVMAALAAPWIFGEALTARRALGIALGLCATLILATEKSG